VAQTQKCGSSSRTPRGSRLSAHGHLIFELVKLNGESPEEVAKELGVQRNVIDNTIIKAMKNCAKFPSAKKSNKNYDKPASDIPISDEELIEIRRAYHSLEAFQLSPEHRAAKEILKARLAKGESEKPEEK
jgi:hypothetical protein